MGLDNQFESKIATIINNLKNHKYPSCGGYGDPYESWGISVLFDEVNIDMFSFNPALKRLVAEAKQEPPLNDEYATHHKFILDYKEGEWILNFEFYDDDAGLDERFSKIFNFKLSEVKTFLLNLMKGNVKMQDVYGNIA
jgi:hypothetical protein